MRVSICVQYNKNSYKNLLFIQKEDRLFISACFKKINIHSMKLFTWNFFHFLYCCPLKLNITAHILKVHDSKNGCSVFMQIFSTKFFYIFLRFIRKKNFCAILKQDADYLLSYEDNATVIIVDRKFIEKHREFNI